MKVILQKDVKKLGYRGDLVDVSPGYAQNMLLPSGLAILATVVALQKAQVFQAERVKSQEEVALKATEIAKELQGLTLTFTEKTSSGKHLYGSITEADIAAALKKEAKIEVEKSKVEMAEHIKELGNYSVTVHLPGGKMATVKVEVTEKEEKEKASKTKTKAKKK